MTMKNVNLSIEEIRDLLANRLITRTSRDRQTFGEPRTVLMAREPWRPRIIAELPAIEYQADNMALWVTNSYKGVCLNLCRHNPHGEWLAAATQPLWAVRTHIQVATVISNHQDGGSFQTRFGLYHIYDFLFPALPFHASGAHECTFAP